MTVSDHLGSGEGAAVRPEVQMTEVVLHDDIEAMLQTMGASLHGHDLLVLPPYRRGGRSLYGPDDLDAVHLARSVGLHAAFLHNAQDREYLHEYSAGWVVEFAVATGSNITAISLAATVKYFMARAQKAVDEGLHKGPTEQVLLRVRVARFRRDANGRLSLKGLDIEGSAAATTAALHILLNPDPKSEDIAQLAASDDTQAALGASSSYADRHNPSDSE